jgi:hypothetical protein
MPWLPGPKYEDLLNSLGATFYNVETSTTDAMFQNGFFLTTKARKARESLYHR